MQYNKDQVNNSRFVSNTQNLLAVFAFMNSSKAEAIVQRKYRALKYP